MATETGWRDRCYFAVGTGHKAQPATYRGLLRARLEAKELVRRGRSGDTYGVRLVCGPAGKRGIVTEIETCRRAPGARAVSCDLRGRK